MDKKYDPKNYSKVLRCSMETVYEAARIWEKERTLISLGNLKNELGPLLTDLKIAAFSHQITETQRDEMKDYFLSLTAGEWK
ncbi:hypothetical protein [Dubosiella newyorkensis]|uniref:hypothetical protein n=1 Tax=Dubosiella newyorkensis TaxID=1862672 RepID=UPI00259A02A2|nr:hypothetical protein [Dubosiella newyorkensis]